MVDLNKITTGLAFDDVLLVPQYSTINSRSEVDLSTEIIPGVKLEMPLISINMDCVTGVDMAIAMGKLGGLGLLPRFDAPEIQAKKVAQVKKAGVITVAAVGCKQGEMKRANVLVEAGVDILTIDIAHGHMQKVLDATSELKNTFRDIPVISGVVASYQGAYNLFKAGADSVRVGIGPGTICTTRIVTGHGVPQITAVAEAARAAAKFGKTVISDGGTKNSGDVVKALAAGAAAVIAGSQFAGTDESPGKTVVVKGKKYKEYNGSTSAKEKARQVKKHCQGKSKNYEKHVEGVEALVPYKGSINDVVGRILAGVRSGFSYSGASNIKELWQRAQFVRITNAGMRESQAHDVIVNG